MKFIITDFFMKQCEKVLSDLSVDELIQKIDIHSKGFIHFKEPYVKVKIRTGTKSYRMVILFDRTEEIILMINIFDKKDKKYGENLTWKLHKNEILLWKKQNEQCIHDGKYRKVIL